MSITLSRISGAGKILVATAVALPLASCTKGNKEEGQRVEQVAPTNPHDRTNSVEEKKNEFGKLLTTDGVTGLVHGSVPGSDLFVFIHGDPIRGGEHFSLIPLNDDIAAKLQKTSRHQAVTIKGTLEEKGTPQKHIVVEGIKLGEVWDPKVNFKYTNQHYSTPSELRKELEGKKEKDINCVVHAVLHEGKVLIVNHKGDVIPVHVTNPKWTKDLRSSDQINLRYKLRKHSEGPLHLSLRFEGDIPPVKVLDPILPLSESKEKFKLTGSLVWFPKSPILTRETWGIKVKSSSGLERTYSLFNLRDKGDVQKIDEILRKEWGKKTEGFIRSSSFFYHPQINLEVTGDIMHFAVNQRNPLVDLDSKDIKILP